MIVINTDKTELSILALTFKDIFWLKSDNHFSPFTVDTW